MNKVLKSISLPESQPLMLMTKDKCLLLACLLQITHLCHPRKRQVCNWASNRWAGTSLFTLLGRRSDKKGEAAASISAWVTSSMHLDPQVCLLLKSHSSGSLSHGYPDMLGESSEGVDNMPTSALNTSSAVIRCKLDSVNSSSCNTNANRKSLSVEGN